MGGDIIGRDGKGRFQSRASKGLRSWDDPQHQEAFLTHLSATANVARSAKTAGLLVDGAYRLRQRDPQFRERWHLALCDGIARVEALLIEGAAAVAEVPRLPDGEIDRIALKDYDPVRAAMAIKIHGPTTRGEALGQGQPVPHSTEALRIMILQKIADARLHLGSAPTAPEAPDALPAPASEESAPDAPPPDALLPDALLGVTDASRSEVGDER